MKLLSLALAGFMAIEPSLSFLLVPTIPQLESTAVDKALPSANEVFVNLACSKCPFPVIQNGDVDFGDGVDSQMAIKFSTSHGRFYMNDMQVYPRPDPLNPSILTGSLRRNSDGVEAPPFPFGYVLETFHTPAKDTHDKSADGLITFRVTVVDLNGVPINMEPVEFRMIRTAGHEHELLFAHVDIEPTMPGDGAPIGWRACNGSPRCYHKVLVARLRMMFAAAKLRAGKLAGGVKGCMGNLHDKIGAWMSGAEPRPGHHHHHHSHHGEENQYAQSESQDMSEHPHHHMNGLVAGLHKIAMVAVPGIFALIFGLVLGMIACFVGIVIARGIVMGCRAIRGQKKGGCCRRKGERREEGDAEENAPLVFDKDVEALHETESPEEDAPPRYEEGEDLKEVHVDVNQKQ